jgi:tetratricopeptide (TPR) repeat protein
MAQPRKSKPTAKSDSPKGSAAALPTVFGELPPFFSNIRLQSAVIFAVAFLLYANTLTHNFTLDDGIVITDNMFTKEGIKGIPGLLSKDTFFGFFKVEGKDQLVSGGRYRPLTPVLFAVLYQIFGNAPWAFHLLTILLFALTCVVLYRTLLLLLAPRGDSYAALFSFVTAMLFAAHPIHTEVVANVKGCDEIVTLLGSLGALYFAVKASDTGAMKWTVAAGITFFLACLSKENAVTFVVIVPLALWWFRSKAQSTTATSDEMPAAPRWSGAIAITIAFLVFFVLRGTILGWRFGAAPMELMNNPYLKISGDHWVPFTFTEKMAAIFYTLWKYVQLLFVPHPLTHDYYPKQIDVMSFSNPMALLSLVGYIGLFLYAVLGRNQRDTVRFGILFYLLTLSIVSNIVFPIGTHMGERFAFMPSVGFCMIIATGIVYLSQKGTKLKMALGVLGVVALLYGLKTVTRNPVWASNDNLFLTDVKVSGNSAKIRNACGGTLFDMAGRETDESKKASLYRECITHLNKAVELYPNYSDAFVTRAGAQFFLKQFDGAIADYRAAIRLAPEKPEYKTYLAVALRDGGKYYGEQKNDLVNALRYLTEAWQVSDKDPETARLLGVANGIQGKGGEALNWFAKAVELAPDNPSYMYDLGTAYYNMGDQAKGTELHEKALKINPKLLEERQKGK